MKSLKNILIVSCVALSWGCAGKYMVKTYPAGAKVYIQGLKSEDKKLVGTSPVQITEESQLGDVFFLVFEKEKYKKKSVMIRVNPGESLAVSTQLDPKIPEDLAGKPKEIAQKDDAGGKDDKPPQSPPKPEDKKKKEDLAKLKELEDEMVDLTLRISLLENTTDLYKDAIFSPRFSSGGVAKFDRDKNDTVVELMFQAQSAITGNKLDKAMKLIEQAIQKDAYVTNAWLLKGSVSYLRRDYKGARKSWERSLELDPYNKVALKYLNGVYKKLGENSVLKKPRVLRSPASLKELQEKRRVRVR